MKATGCVLFFGGIFAMVLQWAGYARSQKTAQMMIDLVSAYGSTTGNMYGWIYVLMPPITIVLGTLILIGEIRGPVKRA